MDDNDIARIIGLTFLGGYLAFLLTLVWRHFIGPYIHAERASVFLDFLESGLRRGRSPNRAWDVDLGQCAMAEGLGRPFRIIGAALEAGRSLESALTGRGVLPDQAIAFLASGERSGQLLNVIPMVRRLVRDMTASRASRRSLVWIRSFVLPFTVITILFLMIFVAPKLSRIYTDMYDGARLPAFTQLVFGLSNFVGNHLALLILIVIFGSGLRWVLGKIPFSRRWIDGVELFLPWKRRRAMRDFFGALGLYLDAGLSESDALGLAGDSIANQAVRQRMRRAEVRLRKGVSLAESLAAIDSSPELKWRLASIHRGFPFRSALAEWEESLDAMASRDERIAVDLLSVGVTLLNGIIIGAFGIAMFLCTTALLVRTGVW